MVLNIKTRLIYLQKLFLGNKDIAYNTFNLSWLKRVKVNTKILTAIKKELENQIIIKN